MSLDLTTVLVSTASSLISATTVGWITKMFVTRYVKNNDERHKKHDEEREKLRDRSAEAFEKLTRSFHKLETGLAVISTKLDQLNGIHKEVIVIQENIKKHDTDIHAAHEKLRSIA